MPAPRPLPDSPDLDQLRRQANELLRSARAADPTALTRFRVLPSLRQASDDLLARTSLESHLSRRPDLAFAPGGTRGWEPIHYVCHTALGQSKVASADGLASRAGADGLWRMNAGSSKEVWSGTRRAVIGAAAPSPGGHMTRHSATVQG